MKYPRLTGSTHHDRISRNRHAEYHLPELVHRHRGLAEHRDDLDNWEGRCHHRSHGTAFGWSIISTTTTDGQPWPEPGEDAVQIFDRSDDVITLGCAQARAEAILRLIHRAGRA